MTKTQALKEAVKRWGKGAAVRDAGKARASTPEKRSAAKEARLELRGLMGEIKPRPSVDLRNFYDQLLGESMAMRYSVGSITEYGLQFFHVRGSGDSWEEAFAKAASA